jgi:hypothetical protein
MNIVSLEKMEQIVSNNKSLSWDGWVVIESKVDPSAWMKPSAMFKNDLWYKVNRYEPSISGWSIPAKLVR